MYRVFYGGELLHDPRTDSALLGDLQLEQNQNECGYCEFTIYPDHPLHGTLKERDMANQIKVYDDEALLFQGFIYELGRDFQTSGTVKCKGDLSLLECSIVRPYSTLEGVYETTAPNTVDGYFKWLIEQHNEQVEQEKRFVIGMNEGSLLDKNNYIYRESKQFPTTAEEIEEKILNQLGGYIRVRYPNGVRTIDLMAECYDANTQIFDFGVNLMDYQETTDALEVYTALVLRGATPERYDLPLTVEFLEDGVYAKDTGFSKLGDMVYSHSAVERYGWIVGTYENQDIVTAEGLLDAGVIALKSCLSPIKTIEVKAVDLSIINKDYQPVQVGEYVRVRSKVHGFDSYMLCTSVSPNLNNPEDSLYTLGMTFDSLTGIQNKRISSLNAAVTKNYERTEAISSEAKAAAIVAGQAQENSEAAKEAAQVAQNKADEAFNDAYEAEQKAQQAKEAADEATAKVTLVEDRVVVVEEGVSSIREYADSAQEAANKAKADAEEAKTAATTASDKAAEAATKAGHVASTVETINREISTIKEDAAEMRSAFEGQIKTVTDTMTADYTKKTELTEATLELQSEITRSAAEIEQSVSANYTKKTELTEVQANLQTQITQTADSIASTVSAVEKAQVDAISAQTKANEAKAAAEAAQGDAATAKSAATEAQEAADEAFRNLAKAESDLADMKDRVDVTEADIAAAEKAVEEARTAANKAQTDAVNANTNAVAAQSSADAATAKADKAQADVNSLTSRVSVAESKIEQTSESITLSVSELRGEIENINIGGRNLLRHTGDMPIVSVYTNANGIGLYNKNNGTLEDTGDGIKLTYDGSGKGAMAVPLAYDGAVGNDETMTLSFDYRGNMTGTTAFYFLQRTTPNVSYSQFPTLQASDSEWLHYEHTFNSSSANVRTCYSFMMLYNPQETFANAWVEIKKGSLKLERGNKATDWTPAHEDTDARITAAETSISQNASAITLRATKTEVDEAIDNISVGGRNLLLASSEEFSITKTTKVFSLSDYGKALLSAGGTVTVSFEVKADVATNVDTYPRTSEAHTSLRKTVAVTTEWKRYSVQIELTEKAWAAWTFRSSDTVTGGSATAVASFRNVKVEAGNKATDWTSAPEDIEDSVDKVKESLTEYATLEVAKNMISSEVTENYVSKTDFGTYFTENFSSSIKQTNDEIDLKVSKTTFGDLETDVADASKRVASLETYVRVTTEGLIVGGTEYPYVARIVGDAFQICIKSGDEYIPISWFASNTAYNENLDVANALSIGKSNNDTDGSYEFHQEADGTLSLIYKS